MFDSFYLIERLDEVEKGFSGLFAEVSYVDSGNDNFFSSGQGYFPSLFGKLFDGSASAFVLYAANEARTVPSIPREVINGCAQ